MSDLIDAVTNNSATGLFIPLLVIVTGLGAVISSISAKSINELKAQAIKNEKKIGVIQRYRQKSEDLLFSHLASLAEAFLISNATKKEKELVIETNKARKADLELIRREEDEELQALENIVVPDFIVFPSFPKMGSK